MKRDGGKSWQSSRVTIKDIAKAAQVDPSTVTRALQDSPRVKSTTRQRIVKLAAEMGYVPDIAARTLVQRRSGLIGVVIPDLTNPFFADLGKGIEDEAAKHDLRVLITDTRGVEAVERDAVRLFLELKVDGLIVPMPRSPQQYYENINALMPIVHVNNDHAAHHVNCDRIGGSMAVMHHLFELGHRRIGFVRGPSAPGREPKMYAYTQSLESVGLNYDPELIFSFDGTMDSSQSIAQRLGSLAPRPTALFAFNDLNAIGVIHGLRELGLHVPGDISIVGHDNIELSAYIDPPLTTVAWPMYELGQQAIKYTMYLRQGEAPKDISLPKPELVVRQSTARPRRK